MILKHFKTKYLFVLLSVLLYLSFAYDLNRNDYLKLISLYVALFVIFYKLIQTKSYSFKLLTLIAFGFRIIFLFSIPNLSQDFYRFIWDGRMILEGYNPYLYTPESFILKSIYPIHQAQELYNGMGLLNGNHFTNYPPINQLCFVIAAIFSGKSILGSALIMRLIIIAADFGTLCFGKKLLEKIDMPVQSIFLYILNPFIIIELTGNLHFEGVMIFFLIWALYLFHLGKWRWSAFIFTCSISVKLIPLIFLPLFVNWFYNGIKSLNNWKQMLSGTKRLIQFYGLIGLITLALFAPFYSSGFIKNYTQTIALWFQDFEFNASLYYIARTIGYSISGYNEINIIGKIIPILVILFVLCMAFFRKNRTTIELITSMLLVLTFYYFTSTTVHPWYIATLLILSIFTRYKFPLVWSFVAILSYLAYANLDNSENLWIIGIEYTCVYSIFIWEVILNKKAMILKS